MSNNNDDLAMWLEIYRLMGPNAIPRRPSYATIEILLVLVVLLLAFH